MSGIQDAEGLVNELFRLAREFPDQPIAIIKQGEQLQVGVLNLFKPDSDDWMYDPVPVDQLMNTVNPDSDH